MTASQPDNICRRVNYRGRVQGVGFRYTTHSIARRHAVTGYVRNLHDGSVELVAVGRAADVAAFVNEVAATFRNNITSMSADDRGSVEEFNDFAIRY
jgi:acylphosphatase